MNTLKQRIIDISYKKKLSHIGSCLTAVDIIDRVYADKKPNEPFILSSGHAGLALYVVIEKYLGIDAEMLFDTYGVHPNRNLKHDIYCSTGSLGHGIGIATGMAISDRSRKVHVLLSDGECAEGSVFESFNVIQQNKISNMVIHINYNSWGAYRKIMMKSIIPLTTIIESTCDVKIHKTDSPGFLFLSGLKAHYAVLSDGEYNQLKKTYET